MTDKIPPGYRLERGLLWPAYDRKCAKVVFKMATDLNVILRFVKKRDVVIQAGGNCGVWPRALAPLFNQVITFEPDPVNYFALCHNIREFPNVHPFNYALGDDNAQRVDMFKPDHEQDNCGALQVRPSQDGQIPVMRLDDLKPPGCDLLYLDIEGFELRALGGAASLIDTFRPVIVLEDKGLSEAYGVPTGAAPLWLRDTFGYRIAERVHRDVVLTP